MKKFLTREEYHQIIGHGMLGEENCPFCNKEEQEGHIIWEGKYWYILHNYAPYSGDHRHLMAVPYEHIKFSHELDKKHFEELKEVHKFMKGFFDGEKYFSFTRESLDDSRSVEHLHIHFLVGKLQGKYLRKMLENQGYPIKQEL